MSLRNNPTKPSQITQKTVDFRLKYKTEKCRYWFETGYCPFGELCAFAHDEREIRNKKELNNHYKTKLCHNFVKMGFCKYGDRCQFLHETLQKDQFNTCETRSNSVQSSDRSSTSPQSKNQQKNRKKCQHKKENKHSVRLQMLTDFGIDTLDILFPNTRCSILTKIIEEFKEELFISTPASSMSLNVSLAKRRLYSL